MESISALPQRKLNNKKFNLLGKEMPLRLANIGRSASRCILRNLTDPANKICLIKTIKRKILLIARNKQTEGGEKVKTNSEEKHGFLII